MSSGHGPREVRTSLQLSDRPLVDHVVFETGDLHALPQICKPHISLVQRTLIFVFLLFLDYTNETVNGDSEDPAFYSTLVCCSLTY